MHNPRGSNNRLNGAGQNRANNNRMCDTQNNAKGGYCWGPPMKFYAGSQLMVEWTHQHAGGNDKLAESEIILQYMCNDGVDDEGEDAPDLVVRDGTVTTTIPDDPETWNDIVNPNPLTGENNDTYVYGMHESYFYYQDCKKRERNKGLFTADQDMRNRNAAKNTRQDNNGNRNGFECPEERDYYPYWHPTPWKDIAVLTQHTKRCEYYKKESQNVKPKGYCTLPEFNHKLSCENNAGVWKQSKPWKDINDELGEPDCIELDWTRDNHLGNTRDGHASTYNWTIPKDYHKNCVLRIRYNISTGDYDNWSSKTNAALNGKKNSPVIQDPDISILGRNLTMALNTDQTARTFQDRSHVFAIQKRPKDIPDNAKIYNLNVRGKRGNIVQVYPAVEYDFVPNVLDVKQGDYIHFQWTGCDTNPANNDGEGTRQTDRSNIVQMKKLSPNTPEDKPENMLFPDAKDRMRMAFIDQTDCPSLAELLAANNNNKGAVEQDVNNCAKLNKAGPYFDGGVFEMKKTGEYHYMGTRNNNFSNRSQKGQINVHEILPTWAITMVIVGAALFVASAVVGATVMYGKAHPTSKIGYAILKVNGKA